MIIVAGILPFPSGSLAAAPGKAGEWSPLLHGDSLEGWYILIRGQERNIDPDHIFSVQDGVVHVFKNTPNGATMPFGAIITEKEYSHFHLRLEFKWGTKKFAPRIDAPRDSGVIYHVVGSDRIWPQGVECQIQEGDVGDIYAVYSTVTTTIDPKTKDNIDPLTKMNSPVFLEAADGGISITYGSINDAARVRRSRDWEHDGWNTVEMIVHGDRAVYLVNGRVNNRCTNICRPNPKDPQRMIPLTRGKILLQAEGAEILYRNIEIKDLSDDAAGFCPPVSLPARIGPLPFPREEPAQLAGGE
jgi:hypothetical protein